MTRRTVRIAMNGVTGRMGYRQHLVRSILAIREQGGLDLGDGDVLWPEPVLVGRRAHALEALAEQHGLTEWSTDLDAVLADESIDIYFDAQVTSARVDAIKKAIAAYSTSTPRSPPPPTSRARSNWPASPATQASSTASYRTRSSSRVCSS